MKKNIISAGSAKLEGKNKKFEKDQGHFYIILNVNIWHQSMQFGNKTKFWNASILWEKQLLERFWIAELKENEEKLTQIFMVFSENQIF